MKHMISQVITHFHHQSTKVDLVLFKGVNLAVGSVRALFASYL